MLGSGGDGIVEGVIGINALFFRASVRRRGRSGEGAIKSWAPRQIGTSFDVCVDKIESLFLSA